MIPKEAVKEKQKKEEDNSLDRRKISQPSRENLKSAISKVDDPDAKEALEHVYEILTGETVSE